MSLLKKYLKNEQNHIAEMQNDIKSYENTIHSLLEIIANNDLLDSNVIELVSSHGELLCEVLLRRELPNYIFKKVRPSWLVNPKTGHKMELDFYCKELKLAIEINGRQHYEYIPYFHKTKENFKKQLERDKAKKKICSREGVHLIEIQDCRNLEYEIKKIKKKFHIKNKTKYVSDDKSELSECDEDNISDEISDSEDDWDEKLRNYLIKHKPNWYVTGVFLKKSYVYKKSCLLLKNDVANNVFWQKMRDKLILKEKIANNHGNKIRKILLKTLW